MSKVRYDISRVPRELLERFVNSHGSLDSYFVATSLVAKDIQEAARLPLRTRAEVDADIAAAVRDYVKEYSDFDGVRIPLMEMKFSGCFGDPSHRSLPEVLIALLSEETSD
jgi:hypothetical protein